MIRRKSRYANTETIEIFRLSQIDRLRIGENVFWGGFERRSFHFQIAENLKVLQTLLNLFSVMVRLDGREN